MRLSHSLTPAERRIVRLVSAIQFINLLDFQMVMPLGADFARDLGIPASRIGWVTGAYSASGFVSGIVGMLLLNRVPRRPALVLSLAGLAIATAIGGLSTSYAMLLAGRILAGFFSGPVVSLSYALLTDAVPEERRGRAMGMVASVYSIAGVVGLPIGLKLAEWGGWRFPFMLVAFIGVASLPLVLRATRSMAPAREAQHAVKSVTMPPPADRRPVTIAFLLTFIGLFGNFLLVPSVAAYLQLNLGYPRDRLSLLYAVAGATTFFSTRLVGRMIDRLGEAVVILLVTPGVIAIYYALFIHYSPALPIMLLFTLSALFNSSRYLVVTTLTSRVPEPGQRAGFLSLMSAAQALGQSAGAFGSSLILTDRGSRLDHIDTAAELASGIAALVPLLLLALDHSVKNRRRQNLELVKSLQITEAEMP